MINSIEENDLMTFCSECGILERKTNFYFRNINEKFRKECTQCTNIKQKELIFINRERMRNYKKQYF